MILSIYTYINICYNLQMFYLQIYKCLQITYICNSCCVCICVCVCVCVCVCTLPTFLYLLEQGTCPSTVDYACSIPRIKSKIFSKEFSARPNMIWPGFHFRQLDLSTLVPEVQVFYGIYRKTFLGFKIQVVLLIKLRLKIFFSQKKGHLMWHGNGPIRRRNQ